VFQWLRKLAGRVKAPEVPHHPDLVPPIPGAYYGPRGPFDSEGNVYCRHCGGTKFFPDYAVYYVDAMTSDGEPLACMGACRDREIAQYYKKS
jgi:hypothetical protein